MKTTKTFLQWIVHVAVAALFIALALIPAGIYATIWWFIPKTFWSILLTSLGGIVWLVVQVIWALTVARWWDELNETPGTNCAYPVVEGDVDISF